MHDGRLIADLVLDLAEQRMRPVTNLALQKLLFFTHAWSLVELGRPLVRHEFEAWEFGPVLPYVYRLFRSQGARPIKRPPDRPIVYVEIIDQASRELVSSALSFYLHLSPSALVALSHVQDGPWDQAWNHKSSINPGMRLPNDRIREFYSLVHRPFPRPSPPTGQLL